jgi:hypothetical protein
MHTYVTYVSIPFNYNVYVEGSIPAVCIGHVEVPCFPIIMRKSGPYFAIVF